MSRRSLLKNHKVKVSVLAVVGCILLFLFLRDKLPTVDNRPKSNVTGQIVDKQGQPVSGIKVTCFVIRIHDGVEWPYGLWDATSDVNGEYSLKVPSGEIAEPFEIRAGGVLSTQVKSPRFQLKMGASYQVDPLAVKVVTAILNGKVLLPSGQVAANMSYGYRTGVIPSRKDLKTDRQGAINEARIFSDADSYFWVIPEKDQAQIWEQIDPNVTDHQFVLDPAKYISLPPGWKEASYLHWFCQAKVQLSGDSIQFQLPDTTGKQVTLDDERFRDKVVLVNLCGSWCGNCKLELPHLVKFKETYGPQGLEIVGIAFEDNATEEATSLVSKMHSDYRLNYPLLLGGPTDDANVASAIKGIEIPHGFPTTFFIGRDGKVKQTQVGFVVGTGRAGIDWQVDQMKQRIEALLAGTAGLNRTR